MTIPKKGGHLGVADPAAWACGRGPCSAREGHEGACSDASGWGVDSWREMWEHTNEQLGLALKREALAKERLDAVVNSDDLAYARADARHHLQRYESAEVELRFVQKAWGDDRAKVVEFARQAREGERLRVAVRHLMNNASAALIHHSGEDCDVVRLSDLQHAMGDNCGRCCDDCQSCPCAEDRGL